MNISLQKVAPKFSSAWSSGQVSYLPQMATSAHQQAVSEGKVPILSSIPAAPKSPRRYAILTASELQETPMKWAVKGLFPQKGLGMIYGASGAGKSFLALDLVAAIAEGRPWFGRRTSAAPIIYLCLEGATGFTMRVRAWEMANGRKLPDSVGFVRDSFSLLDADCVLQILESIRSTHKTIKAGMGPPILVVDTLSRAIPGEEENLSSVMGAVLKACGTISEEMGGLVILVHHTGKDADRGPRGNTALPAGLDGSLGVFRSEKGRFWTFKKVKDGPDGIRGDFELKSVSLGVDEDGDEVSSCVVHGGESTACKVTAPQMSASVKTALLSLQAVLSRTAATERLVGNPSVSLEEWRTELYGRSSARTQSGKRNAFSRALNELKELGYVTEHESSLEVNAAGQEVLSHLSKQCGL